MEIVDRFDALVSGIAVGEPQPDVTLYRFFSPAFMDEHTRFASFADFRDASPWAIDSREEIEEIPSEELDRYVRRTTCFASWREMRNRAAERRTLDRLLV